MDYKELKLTISPNTDENKEIVAATFSAFNYDGFLFSEDSLEIYIPEKDFNEEEIKNRLQNFSDIRISYEINFVQAQKWNEKWTENYYKPMVISEKLLVYASFHKDLPQAEYRIEIDPKTAFGTGNHGTTFMILEEILKLDISGKKVLDMGTGTGILAILSKMKNSGYTLAIDNDPNACINTSENIIINKTPDIEVKEGDINILSAEMFDIIYENIWKNTVIGDLPILFKHLNEGGILITSGYYAKEANEVISAGEKIGFKFVETRENTEWAIVVFKK